MASRDDRSKTIGHNIEDLLGHFGELSSAGSKAVEDFADPARASDIADLDFGALARTSWKFLAEVSMHSARIVQKSAHYADEELRAIREEERRSTKRLRAAPLPILEHVAQAHGDLAAGLLQRPGNAGEEREPATVDDIALAFWAYWRELGRAGIASAEVAGSYADRVTAGKRSSARRSRISRLRLR